MRYFLVDYENISNGGLKNLINIDKGDYTIVVFYSDNAKTIDLHTFAEIINHGNVKLIKTYTGKNAMDFQLVSYLGWLLKNNDKSQYNNKLQVADTVNSEEDSENETVQIPQGDNIIPLFTTCDDEYIIVSNDNGYSPVVDFWDDLGYNIKLLKVGNAFEEPELSSNVSNDIISGKIPPPPIDLLMKSKKQIKPAVDIFKSEQSKRINILSKRLRGKIQEKDIPGVANVLCTENNLNTAIIRAEEYIRKNHHSATKKKVDKIVKNAIVAIEKIYPTIPSM